MAGARGARATLRILALSAYYSYRALFGWVRPRVWFSVKFGMPLLQLSLFALLGKFAGGDEAMRYAAVGNAVHVIGVNAIFGITMVVGAERWGGTLEHIVASPAPRAAMFVGRAGMHVLDGLLSVAIALTYSWAFFGVSFAAASMPLLVGVLLLTTLCLSALGLLLGCLSLYARDVGSVMTAAYLALLALSGVNFPVERLPGWLQPVSAALPLTHGIAAVRAVLDGAPLAALGAELGALLLTGGAALLLGTLLFQRFEAVSLRRGTLTQA